MRIRAIETIPLKTPLPHVFRGSNYYMTHRCTIITRLHTDEGIVGEIYNGDELETQADLVKIIQDELTPLLMGRDIWNVEGCWEAMLPPTYDILRDRKLVLQAIACVDSAIHDARGKAAGLSLSRMWGGYRSELPIIVIGGYYREHKTLADIGREMESYREQGFAGCKFKVGGLTPEQDAQRVKAAREAAGEEFVICIDANQAYQTWDAVRLARLVADYNIRWFEEPCRWYNDRRAMRDVRMIGGIPVTAGQSEVSRAGCRDLIVEGAIDVCNFDASWGSGPTEWLRVARLADAFGVQMGHHEEPQIAAQLLAAVPNGTYLEVFHNDRDPLFYELVANRSVIQGGMYRVPDGPGFGVELDQAAIKRHRID